MNTTWARMRRDDSGATAVTVAILIVVFIGLTALVVDVGYWYNVRRQLQAAADSAALAGCAQLQQTGDANAAWAMAADYASRNAVAPGDGLEVVAPGAGSGSAVSEVGDDYVKVTVRKAAPTFFGGIFGGTDGYIMAQSRAELQWISGMKGLVPLAMPILSMPSRMTVRIGNGGGEASLSKGADGKWYAYGVPAGAAGPTGNQVTVTVYNSQDVPVDIEDAARVVVRQDACPVTDLSLSRYYARPGDAAGIDAFLTSSNPPVKATLGGAHYQAGDFVSVDSDTWRLHLGVPSTTDPYAANDLDITVEGDDGAKKNEYDLSAAAAVISRQSTFPIGNVSLDRYVVAPGSTVDVTVELNDYEYGEVYEMKISDGWGDVGNYMAINLAQIYHPPDLSTPEYDVGSSGASTYRQYLGEKFPYTIHLGDVIYTETGDMKGPTRQGFQDRFNGDSRSFNDWVTAGMPFGWPRLVYVPVVELYGPKGGRRPVIVVAFGSFYVESAANEDVIRGRFVKYVSAGDTVGESEPPVFGVMTPRLVKTDIDF